MSGCADVMRGGWAGVWMEVGELPTWGAWVMKEWVPEGTDPHLSYLPGL